MTRAFQLFLVVALLISSGCGGARLSHNEIRKQIADMGTSTLVPEGIVIRRVVSESSTRAIAETTVELAFQFQRDTPGSPWHIGAVRLGDQNWVSVPELITALNESRRRATVTSLQKLAAGIAAYRQRNGSPPVAANIQALAEVLHPQYMSDLVLDDAWGHKIEVESSSPEFRFRSAGPDGRLGTADDVVSPE
jgi:Type II secretion system (T2SS), protein G